MSTLEKILFNRLDISPKKILFCFIVIFLIILPILHINAQTDTQNGALKNAKQGLITSASQAELTNSDGSLAADPYKLIANMVAWFLSFVGVMLLINLALAGNSWMTAGGNEETIKKAKDKIKNLIIGLIIVVGAYVITDLVFGSLDSFITRSQ